MPVSSMGHALFLTWDEYPEECAWHQAKTLSAFKDFIDYGFAHVRQSQGDLRQSEDIFIRREIQLIDSGRHDYEYEIMFPERAGGAGTPATHRKALDMAIYSST